MKKSKLAKILLFVAIVIVVIKGGGFYGSKMLGVTIFLAMFLLGTLAFYTRGFMREKGLPLKPALFKALKQMKKFILN